VSVAESDELVAELLVSHLAARVDHLLRGGGVVRAGLFRAGLHEIRDET
jgi:hypothetical protein